MGGRCFAWCGFFCWVAFCTLILFYCFLALPEPRYPRMRSVSRVVVFLLFLHPFSSFFLQTPVYQKRLEKSSMHSITAALSISKTSRSPIKSITEFLFIHNTQFYVEDSSMVIPRRTTDLVGGHHHMVQNPLHTFQL